MKYEESMKLLKCPKFINDKNYVYFVDNKTLRSSIEMYSDEYPNLTFKLDINNSKKSNFKITLHLLENGEKIGITRIDYFGKHKNPADINEDVPEFLRQYSEQWFNYN